MTARATYLGLLLSASLVGACGGQSSSSNGNSAGDGAGHGGNASAGSGASTTAGTSSTAGKSPGGASSGGRGGAGTAGTGGASLREACSGPPTLGEPSCSAAFRYYTYDADHGICRPFFYGGCGGTKNLYQSLEACQAACSDLTNYDACTEAAECVLAGAGCCGPCDGPGLTPHDFTAYNTKYSDRQQGCAGVTCGACPNADGELTYKYFIANCVKGRCVVEDLRQTPVTACELDTDCRLRHGKSCCEACGSGLEDVIAVRSDRSIEQLVCGSVSLPCPPCVPAPLEQSAVCTDGRCAIGTP
jgi:hypothetical protein